MTVLLEVAGLVNQFSNSLKLAWLACLVWAAVQIVWYRRARIDAGDADADESPAVVPRAAARPAAGPVPVGRTPARRELDLSASSPASAHAREPLESALTAYRPVGEALVPAHSDRAAAVWAAAFADTTGEDAELLSPAGEEPEPRARRRWPFARRSPAGV